MTAQLNSGTAADCPTRGLCIHTSRILSLQSPFGPSTARHANKWPFYTNIATSCGHSDSRLDVVPRLPDPTRFLLEARFGQNKSGLSAVKPPVCGVCQRLHNRSLDYCLKQFPCILEIFMRGAKSQKRCIEPAQSDAIKGVRILKNAEHPQGGFGI